MKLSNIVMVTRKIKLKSKIRTRIKKGVVTRRAPSKKRKPTTTTKKKRVTSLGVQAPELRAGIRRISDGKVIQKATTAPKRKRRTTRAESEALRRELAQRKTFEQTEEFRKRVVTKKAPVKRVIKTQEAARLREGLAQRFGTALASKIKTTQLAQLSGQFSSKTKEQQRKELEQVIQASVPRTIKTEAQVKTLDVAISSAARRRKKQLDKLKVKGLTLTEKQKLINKVVTGQSMTPKEMTKFNNIKLVEGKKLTKAQWQNFKKFTLVVPSFDYGKNIVIRKQNGEKTPLYNDIKEVGREFKAATYDTGKDIGAFLGTASRKGLISAYNYGKRIQGEALKGNFVLDDDIKKLGNSIIKGAKTATQATQKISTFVKNNPTQSALIVGAIASSIGTSLLNKFQKDPVETLISALLLKGVIIKKVSLKPAINLTKNKINKAVSLFNKKIKKTPKGVEKNLLITSLVESTKFNPALKQIYKNTLNKKSVKELKNILQNVNKQIIIQKQVSKKKITKKLTKTQLEKNLLARAISEARGFKDAKQTEALRKSLLKLSLKKLKTKSKTIKVVKPKPSKIKVTKKLTKTQQKKKLLVSVIAKTRVDTKLPKKEQLLQIEQLKNALSKKTIKELNKLLPKPTIKVVKPKPSKIKITKLQSRKNLLARTISETRGFKDAKQTEALRKSLLKLSLKKLESKLAKVSKKKIKTIDISKVKIKEVTTGIKGKPIKITAKQAKANLQAIAKEEKKTVKFIQLDKPIKVKKGMFANKKAQGRLLQLTKNKTNKITTEYKKLNSEIKTIQIKPTQILKVKTKLTLQEKQKRLRILLQKAIQWELNQMKLKKLNLAINLTRRTTLTKNLINILRLQNKILNRTLQTNNQQFRVQLLRLYNQLPKTENKIIEQTRAIEIINSQLRDIGTAQGVKPITRQLLKELPKKPAKPPKKIRLPEFPVKSKPKGTEFSFTILYKTNGKINRLVTNLPENRAINRAVRLIKERKVKIEDIFASGSTKVKDLATPEVPANLFVRRLQAGKRIKLIKKSKTIKTSKKRRK